MNQFHNCLSECETRTIRFEKAPVIYTLGGRFPRGWLGPTGCRSCRRRHTMWRC